MKSTIIKQNLTQLTRTLLLHVRFWPSITLGILLSVRSMYLVNGVGVYSLFTQLTLLNDEIFSFDECHVELVCYNI